MLSYGVVTWRRVRSREHMVDIKVLLKNRWRDYGWCTQEKESKKLSKSCYRMGCDSMIYDTGRQGCCAYFYGVQVSDRIINKGNKCHMHIPDYAEWMPGR